MASLQTIHGGDIVKIERKGRIFHAVVRGKEPGLLSIQPIERGITYTTASSREVVEHWRKTKNTRKVKGTGQDAT